MHIDIPNIIQANLKYQKVEQLTTTKTMELN